MNDERGQFALPKLYGAPAYARPTAIPVAPVDRPFDPDDLPLESEQSREEREQAERLLAHPYAAVATSGEHGGSGRGGFPILRGRSFRLRGPGRSGEGTQSR